MLGRGRIFILAGPSGVGKNTILERLLAEMHGLVQIPTVTTRPRRSGEKEGKHHFFVSDKEFDSLIESGALLEWKVIHDKRYGTLLETIEEKVLSTGNHTLDIDILGALTLKDKYPNNVTVIFIYPPSVEILEERIRNRGPISDEELTLRLSRVSKELALARKCDYVIVNDDLEEAIGRVKSIIAKEYTVDKGLGIAG
jgi:guanylate kinase